MASGGASRPSGLCLPGKWLVVGSGDELAGARDEFLANIKANGRPSGGLDKEWLTADVDWPRLQWFPSLSFGDLKLARTEIQMTMTSNVFHMLAKATYPETVSWQPQPWRVPKHLASGALVSFTAAQDIAPFLKRDVLAGMSTDPFTQQYYCFAMSQMPFQNYMAWPVDNASNLLNKLKTEAPAMLGPALQQLNSGKIVWNDKQHQLDWVSGEAQPTAPYVEAREDGGQPYLLAGLFPLLRPKTNGPPSAFRPPREPQRCGLLRLGKHRAGESWKNGASLPKCSPFFRDRRRPTEVP